MESLNSGIENFVEEKYGSLPKRLRLDAVSYTQKLELELKKKLTLFSVSPLFLSDNSQSFSSVSPLLFSILLLFLHYSSATVLTPIWLLHAAPLKQVSFSSHVLAVQPSQYNPLDEPSPLGLKLRKSPSLLDLIQMRLSHGSNALSSLTPVENAEPVDKKDAKGSIASCANDKLKASNFAATLLRIGSWEYASRYEGDLVAKCYFAKHKLVWEILDGGLKSKIEIQWSNIMALKAECTDDSPGSLTIVLARQPAFYRETNPQPRKHTLWQACTDFTEGQASMNKQHYIRCPPGVLTKHYEKLIQCDMRLSILSRQTNIVMGSPYFESQASVHENSEESKGDGCNMFPVAAEGSPVSVFQDDALSSRVHLSSIKYEQNPLPVMNTQPTEKTRECYDHDRGRPVSCKLSKMPVEHPYSSVSELVNHIGTRMSVQMTSGNLPSAKTSECQDILENIVQDLLSDTHFATDLDERSLMKKVNSLCYLLQDSPTPSGSQLDGKNSNDVVDHGKKFFELANDSTDQIINNIRPMPEGYIKDYPGSKQVCPMSRKDSWGDLLNLPRIASLPKLSKVLFGIAEDDENQAV